MPLTHQQKDEAIDVYKQEICNAWNLILFLGIGLVTVSICALVYVLFTL